jgi:hypothetical protein
MAPIRLAVLAVSVALALVALCEPCRADSWQFMIGPYNLLLAHRDAMMPWGGVCELNSDTAQAIQLHLNYSGLVVASTVQRQRDNGVTIPDNISALFPPAVGGLATALRCAFEQPPFAPLFECNSFSGTSPTCDAAQYTVFVEYNNTADVSYSALSYSGTSARFTFAARFPTRS